jgi:hypothetical protein
MKPNKTKRQEVITAIKNCQTQEALDALIYNHCNYLFDVLKEDSEMMWYLKNQRRIIIKNEQNNGQRTTA